LVVTEGFRYGFSDRITFEKQARRGIGKLHAADGVGDQDAVRHLIEDGGEPGALRIHRRQTENITGNQGFYGDEQPFKARQIRQGIRISMLLRLMLDPRSETIDPAAQRKITPSKPGGREDVQDNDCDT
jgi:hypothetical protein